jgi:hypothetical protein
MLLGADDPDREVGVHIANAFHRGSGGHPAAED